MSRCQAEFDEFFKEPTAEALEALLKLSADDQVCVCARACVCILKLNADDQMIEDNKRRTRQLGNITFIAELYAHPPLTSILLSRFI